MKKCISICLVLLLTLALCVPAAATGNGQFLHSYYGILAEDDEQYLVVLGAELPSGGSASAALASQSLDGTLCTAADLSLATTIYCVVDTSSSMPKEAKDAAVNILNSLNATMREGDIMVILTVGSELLESEPLTTAEQRRTAISDIEFAYYKKTNLYQAVTTGLESLSTKSAYTLNKCMLILSDGAQDGSSSVTEDGALTNIKESTIPVYSVGLLQSYPSDTTRNKTQTLERMTEASVGGIFYDTSSTGTESTLIATSVWSSMQNASVVALDLSGLDRSSLGDSMLLTVRYTMTDSTWEDSINVLTQDLPETGKTFPNTSISAVETVPVTVEDEDDEFPIGLAIGIGAAVIAVIAAIVVVIVVRKKRSEDTGTVIQDIGVTTSSDMGTSDGTITVAAGTKVDTVGDTIGDSGLISTEATGFGPTTPCLQLCFTTIGHSDQVFRFSIPEGKATMLGRDNRADVIVAVNGQTDPKLSGRHCSLYWTKGKLYVSDAKSTNGTLVNGSRLVPGTQQKLEQGDQLSIGSRTFRVSFYEAAASASAAQDYGPTTF